MKRLLIMMLALTLWLTSITGATLSYFTAQSDSMTVRFTAGTLSVAALQPQVSVGWDEWSPNNPQTVTWTFENVGTKRSYLRARINTQWTFDSTPIYQDESVWAGFRNVDHNHDQYAKVFGSGGGNSPRYFSLDVTDLPRTMTLAYGGGPVEHSAGHAVFSRSEDETKLLVKVNLDPGWQLKAPDEAHLHISNNESDYDPGPTPGGFLYKNFNLTESTFTVDLPNSNFDINQPMFVALHLGIENNTVGGTGIFSSNDASTNPVWTQIDPFWRRASDGYWYYCPAVLSGETVSLTFTLSLLPYEPIPVPLGSAYSISLTLEAIQTTNGAVELHWPDRPQCTP